MLIVALALLSGRAGADSSEHVVLLHGLARSARSMAPLAERLETAGFRAHNLDYPSTDHAPEALLAWLDDALGRCCASDDGKLHFVTHSLGGILVRAHLEQKRPERLGRVVLIAPPNGGSEIVDRLGDNPVFAAILGPTAIELGTDADSFPNSVGPPDYELGIIAGSKSLNPVGSALLPGADDGAVTIENTRLDGATDFILVEANHTFIMRDEEVARQVVHFFRSGSFDRAIAVEQESAN